MANDLPGDGIGWFVRDQGEFKTLSRRARQAIVEGVLSDVFAYPRWNAVLTALGLEPLSVSFAPALESAAEYRGGGESEQHK